MTGRSSRSPERGLPLVGPPDPLLDRDGWFERCRPAAGRGQRFRTIRLLGSGDGVTVTYELLRPDGSASRTTEILSFDEDDRIVRTEVYVGWESR